MDPGEIDCKCFVRGLADYVAGETDERERGRFDRHLKTCQDCRSYLRDYELTIGHAKDALRDDDPSVADGALPEELKDKILRAIRHDR
ncbi:MAG TPA: zf-HC2 domain-containing protein [Candidatus Binatia bacterium]